MLPILSALSFGSSALLSGFVAGAPGNDVGTGLDDNMDGFLVKIPLLEVDSISSKSRESKSDSSAFTISSNNPPAEPGLSCKVEGCILGISTLSEGLCDSALSKSGAGVLFGAAASSDEAFFAERRDPPKDGSLDEFPRESLGSFEPGSPLSILSAMSCYTLRF